ncbi:MAG: response regulator transcription factor [Synergistaceae bacterium]|nr:response regulator transcription factor [Synergistaceae bacterium]
MNVNVNVNVKKILIVEDMTLLRDTLMNTVNSQEDMRVIGVTVDAAEALDLCRKLEPDLALMDVVTEGKSSGIAAAAEIRRELPDIKIVIMTAMPEITFIDAARKAGAHSFVYKNSDSRHLLHVIRGTLNGNGIFPRPGEDALSKARFSDAEMAIIRLVCQGKSRSEMAAALSLSESRIKQLVTGILNKTGFENILKFSVYAVANGFIVPDGG